MHKPVFDRPMCRRAHRAAIQLGVSSSPRSLTGPATLRVEVQEMADSTVRFKLAELKGNERKLKDIEFQDYRDQGCCGVASKYPIKPKCAVLARFARPMSNAPSERCELMNAKWMERLAVCFLAELEKKRRRKIFSMPVSGS
jgi:hypothetical protein